jgi:alanyl-tRNA synthetase
MQISQMQSMSSTSIVERYLAFFAAQGHLELPGSPLVVPGSTTSFTIAGMQPLLPYLRGQVTPPSTRLTSLQRVLRTVDVDGVGTNERKLTFFHMLGNWSVGDYGKRGVIELALELLGDFGFERQSLWVTTFAGDHALGLPPDEEAIEEWLRQGFPAERIVSLGVDDNLWTMGGPGPCGPCSEIFVDRGVELGCGKTTCQPGCDCPRFLEIWNLVFIEFERFADGSLSRLPFLSIDTGMGLERVALLLQDVPSVFETDLFLPAAARLNELASPGIRDVILSEAKNLPVEGSSIEQRARRIILDHTRAALFAGLEGVVPGREGRSSVLRRLVRRASRQGRILGIDHPFLGELIMPLAEGHAFLLTAQERQRLPIVSDMLENEETQFARVLTSGLKRLDKLLPNEQGLIAGEDLFKLHAEQGFPSDLAAEILVERGLSVDWSGYERALEQHRNISRVSAKRHFL